MIGRHFWPHGCIDSAGHLVQLASALQKQGVDVEVCTPRYASSWPERFVFREMIVHRPAAAPRSDWSMGRYTRHLTQWLRQHLSSFDVVYVDSIREESIAAIEAARSANCTTVLRYAGWGAQSDAPWWQTSRAARRCGSIGKMADLVIAKSAECQRTLLAQGYSPARVKRIDNGFSTALPTSLTAKSTARKILATVNGDLATDANSPVVICNATMTRDSGIGLLVGAARHLVAKHPDLRLWMIGDGPHRDWIYNQLRSDGVRASIAMPGSFCQVDELFAAADVFLQTDENGLDYFLPAAVSRELPIVTIDAHSTRTMLSAPTGSGVNSEQQVVWIAEPNSKSLRIAVRFALETIDQRRQFAGQLRKSMLRTRPTSQSAKALLDEVVEIRSTGLPKDHGTSMEVMQ